MPAISAGIFGFPKDRCARIIMEEVASFVNPGTAIKTIDIYLMDPQIIGLFSKEMEQMERVS
jgi:O-acetyl-ADP-ribose deacetylase (regulator of RNase III)